CSLYFSQHTRPPRDLHPFPYTTLFRSPAAQRQYRRDVRTQRVADHHELIGGNAELIQQPRVGARVLLADDLDAPEQVGQPRVARSEEHTSELQSRENLVCRLLLEKKKI